MTQQDYRQIISVAPRNEEGHVRALASRFVDGVPLGPWHLEGTRGDDPNDRVKHEHRREIRGMRVISSWLNDTDRRDANTMADLHRIMATSSTWCRILVIRWERTALRYPPANLRSGLPDRSAVYGRFCRNAWGTAVHPWEEIDAAEFIPHPSVGYFRSETFRPGSWVSAHPIPAFENMTPTRCLLGRQAGDEFQ